MHEHRGGDLDRRVVDLRGGWGGTAVLPDES